MPAADMLGRSIRSRALIQDVRLQTRRSLGRGDFDQQVGVTSP